MTHTKNPKRHPDHPSHHEPADHGTAPAHGGGHHEAVQPHSHEHDTHAVHHHDTDHRHHE